MLADALLLQLGYNATLVALGAGLLGIASGVAGTFLFLRKRALVSDAISHATLPGVGLAFVVMVAMGGEGRSLFGLLLGAGVSAALGLLCVQWLSRRTRLGEDAAIGAVLSVFFGFGVVMLTVIQTMNAGRQAGLEGFLLGSTAGMLRGDAILLAVSAAAVLALVMILRRPLALAAFDPGYAEATGWSLPRIDLAMMGIVLVVTVVGLKVVGLILIVALLIIPAVTARFWTERADHVVIIAGGVGGLSGYVGAAVSATAPALPTGPIVVLVGFGIFLFSLLFSPRRGVLASVLTHLRYQRRVHVRQGLLALAQGQPIYEALTRRLLARSGLILPDGVPTSEGQAAASKALLDETRWAIVRGDQAYALAATRYDGLTPIETVLTRDQLLEVDGKITAPRGLV
ncbi:metal ABC transporter permease [Tateyamaria omphalii]|uniref:Zinc ABC transporter permease n=1 Tax=Tateyamaria omphalii TaxID=299262 RepID=A0A1P8MZ71_9RHOB|nr:iron chelate uptake ABC transporter family permease subunit [Tateyamaria omphalii]APX13380.1 zinc ABC transporter permease [Tateyamaria omphalii]